MARSRQTEVLSLVDICSSSILSSTRTAKKVAICAPPTVHVLLLENAIAVKAVMWIQLFFFFRHVQGGRLCITPKSCSMLIKNASERAVDEGWLLELCRSRYSWFRGYDRVSGALSLEVVMAMLNGIHMKWAAAASERVENFEVDFTAVSVQHFSDTTLQSLGAMLKLAQGKFPGRLPQDYGSSIGSKSPTLSLPAPFSISLNIVNAEEKPVGEFLAQSGQLRSALQIEHIDCTRVSLSPILSMVTTPNCLKYLRGLSISLCGEEVAEVVKFFRVIGRTIRLTELKVVLVFNGAFNNSSENLNLVAFLTMPNGFSNCMAMQPMLQCLTIHYSLFKLGEFSRAVSTALANLTHPLKSLTLQGGKLEIEAHDFCALLQNQRHSICQLFISANITAFEFEAGERFAKITQCLSTCTKLAVASFEVPESNFLLTLQTVAACPNLEILRWKRNRNLSTSEFLQIGRVLAQHFPRLQHCFLHFGPGKLFIDMIAVRDGKLEELNDVLASIIGDRQPDEAVQTLSVPLKCPLLLSWLQEIRPNVDFALC